eukprot:TRINITY_DN6130_c0_g1_i1.p1 TRINITY_DN6130_c0_g1~~TRINITY_DN6130_c0_g1_i1.p1  ORF type:complete len:940 (+),score=212.14 TRINITY_DN6130_c0_g1_i1:93-2822(+)
MAGAAERWGAALDESDASDAELPLLSGEHHSCLAYGEAPSLPEHSQPGRRRARAKPVCLYLAGTLIAAAWLLHIAGSSDDALRADGDIAGEGSDATPSEVLEDDGVDLPSMPELVSCVALCAAWSTMLLWVAARHTGGSLYRVFTYARDLVQMTIVHGGNIRKVLCDEETMGWLYYADWLHSELVPTNADRTEKRVIEWKNDWKKVPKGLRVNVDETKACGKRGGTVVNYVEGKGVIKVCLDFEAETKAPGNELAMYQDKYGGTIQEFRVKPEGITVDQPPHMLVEKEGWALRLMPSARNMTCPPGTILTHDGGGEDCQGQGWHQRKVYLSDNHLKEDSVRHELVTRLTPAGELLLKVFCIFTFVACGVCLLLCFSIYLPVWLQRFKKHSKYTGWAPVAVGSDFENQTIAVTLSNARNMCGRFRFVVTPLMLSSVQVAVTHVIVTLFIGLPQKGTLEPDWREGLCACDSSEPRAGSPRRTARGPPRSPPQAPLSRTVTSSTVASSPGGTTTVSSEKRFAARIGFGYAIVNIAMFLLQYFKVYREGRLNFLFDWTQPWAVKWEEYQVALVLLAMNPSALALAQLLIRMRSGQTTPGSLQKKVTFVGFFALAIVGVPATLTHALPALLMAAGTLIVYPFAAPVLYLLQINGVGLPPWLSPWHAALAVRTMLATIGSKLFALMLALFTHAVLQYPVASLIVLCSCYRRTAQREFFEMLKLAKEKWEASGGAKACAKDFLFEVHDGEIDKDRPLRIPYGTVVRIPDNSREWYKKNGLRGHYAEHRGVITEGGPVWRFDTARCVSLPFGLDKGPTAIGEPADPCDLLRWGGISTGVYALWSKALPQAANAVLLATIASFFMQSLIVYQVLVWDQWSRNDFDHYYEVPVTEFDARNLNRWIVCSSQNLWAMLHFV